MPGQEHWARSDSRKAPARDGGAAREAVKVARLMESLSALPNAVKAAVLVGAEQEKLWRPRHSAGIALNEILLQATAEQLDLQRKEFRARLGADVFDDLVAAVWAPAHGVTCVNRAGEPSVAREDLRNAVVAPGFEDDFLVFQQARRVASHVAKVRELSRASRNGRIYPHITPYAARTGRTTVWGPALQNITPSSRGLLAADPGFSLVALDYDKMEPTVAAGLSGDSALAADLAAGDLYLSLAIRAGGTAADRDLFKTAWLAVMYGQGAVSMARALRITRAEADTLRAGIWRAYPQLEAYLAEERRAFKAGTRSPLESGRPFGVEPGEHTLLNSRIQAHSADLLYAATARAADALGREALWLTVHDELVVHVPAREADAAREVLASVMPTSVSGVPLSGEAKVLGAAWGKG